MLRQKLLTELKLAMKARNRLRLEAVRYLLALIQNAEIDKHGEVTDEELMKITRSEIKKRREALRLAQGKLGEKGKKWVEDEEAKIKVLQEFLPEQMGEREIEKIIDQIISESGERDFGKVMKLVMQQVAGRAEGKVVAEVVKRKFTV